MKRLLLPFIAVVLFFLEPVFSIFSPVEISGNSFTLVPRFVLIFLIFLVAYTSRKEAMILGIVLGLLYDMFHIDIIGLYAFLYPLVCFIAGLIIREVHRHIVTVMFLALAMIIVLEFFSFLFADLISLTSIDMNDFIVTRLVPTMIANSVFIVMFGWLIKWIIYKTGANRPGEYV